MSASEISHTPGVSVIMPARDEEQHLADAVAGVLEQKYAGELELVIAVGPSSDRTADIAQQLAAADARIRVVDNPAGVTPAGLNVALHAAKHQIIVRADGHGALSESYIQTAVDVLMDTGAANVGGIMLARGHTNFEAAVACAYTSKWGLGGGRFHIGGEAGPADTVYLGVFRREVLEELGGFDEDFHRAQDWELNYRIRQAGEKVWFTPDLTVTYRPRSTFRALVRQFFSTGRWRREVIRRYPDTANPRYLAPPVVTAAVTLGFLLPIIGALTGIGSLLWALLAPALYLVGVVAASLSASKGMRLGAKVWVPAVLVTMHITWGAGFLRGLRRNSRPQGRSQKGSL